MNETFIKPRYDSGGFAGIPNRIKEAFASKKYDAVVMFFVDAFGWRFYERFQDAAFIKRIAKHGKIEKLTSQFPSTTAAHVTTMHTGLPVGESGVHEWYHYEPSVDRIVAPLLFSFAGTSERDTLNKVKAKPEDLYPQGIFYPELKKMGVDAFNFGLRDYTPSTFSKVAMKDAELRSFKTLSEALVNMGALLKEQKKPTYIQLYFDKIDSLAHEYGPAAPQTEAEIETFLLIMEYYFERVFKGKKKILFMMTADHGMCEVSPQATTYLNIDPEFKGFERFVRKNRKGNLLIPAGSARDMFLYIKDDMLDEAQAFLAKRLEGKADVVKTEALINKGYFGEKISARFRERVANLVVLSYRHRAVWWYEKDKYEMKYFGHHGGLTPQEMEIPLYLYEI
ncbi:MAG: alkaline phosphatase family protein [Anaerolineales bacterium]|nr:alkaline phosphatase family protein [Anaerolineales bacterium]